MRSGNQSPSRGVSRRRFLQSSAQAAVASTSIATFTRTSRAHPRPAPSERITIGIIGAGPRGTGVLRRFLNESDVRVVAVADVQQRRREATKALVDRTYDDHGCRVYADFRDLLASPGIDAVLIATGDRWHALASICAAKAGKDIFCEKPCSMTIAESRALAETINRYGRIYQAGTQRRTIPNFIYAVDLVHRGKLGQLRTLHAHTLDPATTHAWLPEEPTPTKEVVDWDMWLGPAPWRPYNSQYVAGRWRDHYDFHSGGILEWGSHTVDLCQWANQADDTTPVEYEPTTDGAVARYANGVELVMRGHGTGWLGLGTCSVRFEGDEGWIETGDSGQFVVSLASLRSALRIEEMAGTDPKYHVQEFIRSVKTLSQPSSNASVAAQSHIACHAATIAWRLGRKIKFDPSTDSFVNDPEADRLRARALRDPWQI